MVTVNDKMLTYEIGAMEIRGEKLLGYCGFIWLLEGTKTDFIVV